MINNQITIVFNYKNFDNIFNTEIPLKINEKYFADVFDNEIYLADALFANSIQVRLYYFRKNRNRIILFYFILFYFAILKYNLHTVIFRFWLPIFFFFFIHLFLFYDNEK